MTIPIHPNAQREAPWVALERKANDSIDQSVEQACALLEEAAGWASAIGDNNLHARLTNAASKARSAARELRKPRVRLSDEARRIRTTP